MSDFGSMVTVRRVDGDHTTAADAVLVKRLARDLVIGPGNRISDYADYELQYGGSRSMSGNEGIFVGLTAYMSGYENENDGWSDEALIARDERLAEQFAEDLQALLGPGFIVQASAGYW